MPTESNESSQSQPTRAQTTNHADIFDDAAAAAYVGGVKARAVRDWRMRRGLPYIRITSKVCRIRRADLDKWLARHQVAKIGGAQ